MDESRFNNTDAEGGIGTTGTNVGDTSSMNSSGSMAGGQFGTGTTGNVDIGGEMPGVSHSTEDSSGFSSNVVSMLEKFGVGESQLTAVRDALRNVNVDQSLEKAREQVNEAVTNARQYAKKNPGAVMAGVAVVVIGAGLIAGAALRRNTEKL